jgi:hypothetical protein
VVGRRLTRIVFVAQDPMLDSGSAGVAAAPTIAQYRSGRPVDHSWVVPSTELS